VPYLTAAFLILLLLVAPSSALGQAGVSYQVPASNPFVGVAGAAPEVYALGLRNPFRFSFDRLTGDILIGDVGQGAQEEVDWIGQAAVRGANFGWACREGKLPGPRANEPEHCPIANPVEPLFVYADDPAVGDAVTGGFVVRDPSLTGLVGRYLYGDFFDGDIRSLALDFAAPDDQSTGLTVSQLASFGEDASGALYAVSLGGNVVRLVRGGSPGMLAADPLTGPFSAPIAIGTFPGDATRLFVAQRGGNVRLVVSNTARSTPYLDIGQFGVSTDGERGLLSVAAAPDYPVSGRIYVYYTDSGGDVRIDEFTRSAADPETADPASRRNLLTIEHSQANNHNGGQLQFGADGCLWITTGDGGGGNDEFSNAQNLGTLLGKVLRIDPDPPGVGGPRCGGQGAPAGGGPGGGPGPDLTAPVVSARAPRRQRVLRRRGVVVYVRCNENCSLGAGGTLLIGRQKLLLRQVKAALVANERARLLVRLRPRARRLLRAALRRGGRPRVGLRLRATDGAGNRSAVVRRGVRVRR
jgi:glucose/arabinose dehydrogenase